MEKLIRKVYNQNLNFIQIKRKLISWDAELEYRLYKIRVVFPPLKEINNKITESHRWEKRPDIATYTSHTLFLSVTLSLDSVCEEFRKPFIISATQTLKMYQKKLLCNVLKHNNRHANIYLFKIFALSRRRLFCCVLFDCKVK